MGIYLFVVEPVPEHTLLVTDDENACFGCDKHLFLLPVLAGFN